MLSELLLPILRERFSGRGLVEGKPPDPCAMFPGIHPGIRCVSIYDDGYELTLCVDDLTHGHFDDYTDGLPDTEREQRIVGGAVEFLDALFTDKVVVWGEPSMGGWYRPGVGNSSRNTVIQAGNSSSKAKVHEFVWSGPYIQIHDVPNTSPAPPT